MPNPYLAYASNWDWRNMHGNVTRTVERHYDIWNLWDGGVHPAPPAWQAGVAALNAIFAQAVAAGKKVRGEGGGWSLSEIAATSDWLLNTKPLNAMTIGVDPSWVDSSCPVSAASVLFAQCGAQIVELNAQLATQNLSLKTSGASNGQTLAGAIATGTHGAALDVGALHDTVLGLHVLVGDGTSVWIERASRPFATPAFLAHLGARLVRDETSFRAAVVGLGAFGFVHAVALEVEPIYLLERTVRRSTLREVRATMSTLDVGPLNLPGGAARPFHFEVVFNPNADLAGEHTAYVRVMYKHPSPGQSPPPPTTVVSNGPSPDLLAVIGQLAGALPIGVREAVDLLCSLACPLAERVSQTHRETFGTTTTAEPGVSIELGVALGDAVKVVDTLTAMARRSPFRGMVGVRYVKSTDALLGFTCHGATTCTMEIPMPDDVGSLARYDELLHALDDAQIRYTMHWGQCLPARYDGNQVRQVFDGRVDEWIAARQRIVPTAARALFANDVTTRLRLDV